MPDVPAAALDAAARELGRQCHGGPPDESDIQLAADVLAVAAPLLAEHIATAILAHAERQFPKRDPAKRAGKPDIWRTWHRHFGIAARVAAGAFYTDEDKMRLAATAIERGDFIACDIPEVPGQ